MKCMTDSRRNSRMIAGWIIFILMAFCAGVFCAAAEGAPSPEKTSSGEGIIPGRSDYHVPTFGNNVWFFAPEDEPELVQKELDAIWKSQETNQFGDLRYSVYFLPGRYDDLIQPMVGFYTQVAGLGASPNDVSLYTAGTDAAWLGEGSALCNFWRGVENLSTRNSAIWAVSQATFMRRVHIGGSLDLQDHLGSGSGGFLANSRVEEAVNSWSQQQWFSRNCHWDIWHGGGWSRVFAGITPGKVPQGSWPEQKYTNIPVVAEIREKPFLIYDEKQGFGISVPPLRTSAVGLDWAPGYFYPISDFHVALPEVDTAATINEALKSGKHLFLTPGVYEISEPIIVSRDGTVVLGSGLATLRSMNGNACLEVQGDANVILAGILFDAGPVETQQLLIVGTEEPEAAADMKSGYSPTLLADLFFRVGGVSDYSTNVECCAVLNQNGIIGDNFWFWRADHGSGENWDTGVGWEVNRAKNGIRVTGNDVTIYALMVEHYQEYQTIWEGENGKIIFYQSETPYDVPNQASWMSHDNTVNGFASVKVGDNVMKHEAWGVGVYLYNRDAEVELHSAVEVPENAEDVRFHHVFTVMLNGYPGIRHIINDTGDAVTKPVEIAVLSEW